MQLAHENKTLNAVQGTVGKSAVLGIQDRKTNQVQAQVIEDTTMPTIQGFVNDVRSKDASVFTDDHTSYEGLTHHTSVNHNKEQWAVSTTLGEVAHTNGIESLWATLTRAYHGTYKQLSKKRLSRYVTQIAGRHNLHDLGTADQMLLVVHEMVGTRLRYKDLIA